MNKQKNFSGWLGAAKTILAETELDIPALNTGKLPPVVATATRILVRRPLLPTPSAALDFGAYPLSSGGSMEHDLAPETALPERNINAALDILATCNLYTEA